MRPRRPAGVKNVMTIRYNGCVSTRSSGSLLREARHRAGLSQAEVGRRAGVTQSVVSAYESGARQPALATLTRLVEAVGLHLDVAVREPERVTAARNDAASKQLFRHRHGVRTIAARYGLSNVRVFGSVARGEDTPGSDIDLLVDVAPGVGLLGLARCERDLEALLGVPVDLVPASDLKPGVAISALADAQSL